MQVVCQNRRISALGQNATEWLQLCAWVRVSSYNNASVRLCTEESVTPGINGDSSSLHRVHPQVSGPRTDVETGEGARAATLVAPSNAGAITRSRSRPRSRSSGLDL